MLISILVANYNNSRYLKQSLDSVIAQNFSEWEIILVDDDSTDGFENIIRAYADEKRIKIFRNVRNMGCRLTKRRCIEKAIGEILAFLDPDDSLEAGVLRIMHDAHQSRPDCSIIHSTHYVCDDSLTKLRVAPYPRALPEGIPFLLLGDGSVHHFATFKKSCYNKTGGLSLVRGEDKAIDMELYYLLEEEGNILFIDRPLYNYRVHADSISNLGNVSKATMAHYSIIEEACKRRINRIKKMKRSSRPDASYWIRKYRTRYYKISILNSFRRKHWLRFAGCLLVFPFIGGMKNLVSYIKKLPTEGYALIRRSLLEDYNVLDNRHA